MALGGGTFTAQNKKIAGAYINFMSAHTSGIVLGDRGTVAIALETDWGKSGITEITTDVLTKDMLKTFGYSFEDNKNLTIREIMKHAIRCLVYRLNADGVKASGTFGTALYSGTRGNDIKIVVTANVDDSSLFDVLTYVGTTLVDKQSGIDEYSSLVDNDFVTFDKTSATLVVTSADTFTGGTNSTVTGANHSAFLSAIESESYDVLTTVSTDTAIKNLYVAYTKRMIEEIGKKIQTVLYNVSADYEAIINVTTSADLVPWVAGAEAGCGINESLTNNTYDGELTITSSLTQTQLDEAVDNGEFVFHKVGKDYNILSDINSLVTVTADKNAKFKKNQTIRVLWQIGNDVAITWNKNYLARVQNGDAERMDFWSALVDYFNDLRKLRCIKEFNSTRDIVVEEGETDDAVAVTINIAPMLAMEKLYMTVIVA